MGKVRVNEYVLTSPKINKDKIILNVSDIHGNTQKLKDIIEFVKITKIDFICMPGDIIDTLDQEGHLEFANTLKELSKYITIYITLGNHDIKFKDETHIDRTKIDKYTFFKEMKNFKNGKLVKEDFDNINLEDNITVNLINYPTKYYSNKDDIEELKKYDKNIKLNIDKSKFNILLVHSPTGIVNKNEIIINNITKDMDLILCGHNHGGLMLPFIQDILHNHVGLIGPYHLFQNNSYGVWNTNNICMLVSNGVEKVSATSSFKITHPFIKPFFNSEIDLIYLTNSDKQEIRLKKRRIYNF